MSPRASTSAGLFGAGPRLFSSRTGRAQSIAASGSSTVWRSDQVDLGANGADLGDQPAGRRPGERRHPASATSHCARRRRRRARRGPRRHASRGGGRSRDSVRADRAVGRVAAGANRAWCGPRSRRCQASLPNFSIAPRGPSRPRRAHRLRSGGSCGVRGVGGSPARPRSVGGRCSSPPACAAGRSRAAAGRGSGLATGLPLTGNFGSAASIAALGRVSSSSVLP